MTIIRLSAIFLYTAVFSVIALIFDLFDRSFGSYFWLQKLFSGGVLWLSGVKVKVSGKDNVDDGQVYVYVSNHSSQFDIVVLQRWLTRRIGIIFKKELARIPVFGWQLQLGPHIKIDRSNAERAIRSIEEAKVRMTKKRTSVVVFAEGTRSKTGEIQPFKRGAFNLAAKVGYPVVPVTVKGTDKIMPKGSFKIEPREVLLIIDKPITTENINSRQDELDLMEKVRDIIIQNYNKYD